MLAEPLHTHTTRFAGRPGLRRWRHLTLAAVFAAGLIVALLALLGGAQPARAASFVVTKTEDTADGACDADCSLREAIIAANDNPGVDIITVPAGVYALTIGMLEVTGPTTINGAGAGVTVIDGVSGGFSIWVYSKLVMRHGILPVSGAETSSTGGESCLTTQIPLYRNFMPSSNPC